ncbi:MAG: hypothetical protein KDC28_12525 [Saprospiraceae bacterium]|nr:hypothetical protein [Saprospiraceae bacterium]MCB9318123.1 hypothetical protein [Lewinellaceae bacterium]
MKAFLVFPFVFMLAMSCSSGQSNSTSSAANIAATRIELIDFYGTHRCETCMAIEANSKYTVDTYFQDALKSGKLLFKTVNVDEEKNYALAEKFEAAGTSLFINVIKDGQEQHIDLTNFAFEKGRDQEAFSAELKQKIEEQLKAL